MKDDLKVPKVMGRTEITRDGILRVKEFEGKGLGSNRSEVRNSYLLTTVSLRYSVYRNDYTSRCRTPKHQRYAMLTMLLRPAVSVSHFLH